MSWSNAAVPSAPDTQYHFPRGRFSRIYDARRHRLASTQERYRGETGFFCKPRDANAFGASHPSVGAGSITLPMNGSRPNETVELRRREKDACGDSEHGTERSVRRDPGRTTGISPPSWSSARARPDRTWSSGSPRQALDIYALEDSERTARTHHGRAAVEWPREERCRCGGIS